MELRGFKVKIPEWSGDDVHDIDAYSVNDAACRVVRKNDDEPDNWDVEVLVLVENEWKPFFVTRIFDISYRAFARKQPV